VTKQGVFQQKISGQKKPFFNFSAIAFMEDIGTENFGEQVPRNSGVL
jgi:hypothetical protein